MKIRPSTGFLNVDLDIRSSSNLEPLLVALCKQKKAFVLHAEHHKKHVLPVLNLMAELNYRQIQPCAAFAP